MHYLPRYRECFFCGPGGEGVKMRMQVGEAGVFSAFILDNRFQGYSNIAHGGIVTGILDEIMWWTVFVRMRKISMTWKLETEFLRPVFCGEPYRAEGSVDGHDRRDIHASALIRAPKGKIAASAKGVFRIAQRIAKDDFAEKLDFLDVPVALRDALIEALK